MSASDRQEKLKEQCIQARERWTDRWDSIAALDPDYVEAFLSLKSVPLRNKHLSAKVQEFILIAIDAATTHMYTTGVQTHIKAALAYGASAAEIMEVIELTSAVGIHACNLGAPLLLEVLQEEGLGGPTPLLDSRREQLKADFIEKRGYWSSSWDPVLQIDPEFFEGYVNFSSVPWLKGVLDPKVKELVYCAFDAATTHLHERGLKIHMRNALRYGATLEEIMEVLELASLMGIHGPLVSAPILRQELRNKAS